MTHIRRRILIVFGASFVVMVGGVLRGLALTSRQLQIPTAPQRPVDQAGVAQRLARAIQFRTVSHTDATHVSVKEFQGLQDFLEASYPRVHATLARERVGGHSLLYTWQGRDPSHGPVVLMGHQDVVPADDLEQWVHPPFSGTVADGYVWGRGAIDNKLHVIVILEAVEALLREGFTPGPTIYLAFGHDEEVGGHHGATEIARVLEARGVKPALVLDEGSWAIRRVIPLIGDRPVALVGIAEKGAANVRLSARYDGPAHSSIPPPKTPVGRLASAIDRLEAHQRPAHITKAFSSLLDFLGPELPLAGRIVVANRPITNPLLRWAFLRSPTTAALLRTTTAATMFEGSSKENIIPAEAHAVINFRILPGESVESTLGHVRRAIRDDTIEITDYRSREPSPVSPLDTDAFAMVQRTITELVPDAVVAPWLMTGGTDSRHYRILTDRVYSYSPGVFTMDALAGAHGVNERISIENLVLGVRFYTRLIENSTRSVRGARPQGTDAAPKGAT